MSNDKINLIFQNLIVMILQCIFSLILNFSGSHFMFPYLLDAVSYTTNNVCGCEHEKWLGTIPQFARNTSCNLRFVVYFIVYDI